LVGENTDHRQKTFIKRHAVSIFFPNKQHGKNLMAILVTHGLKQYARDVSGGKTPRTLPTDVSFD
jgi:hypothetical protein